MNDIRNGINRRRLLRGAGAAAGMIGVGSLGVPARVEARASSSSASGNLVILHSSDDQPYLEYLKANFAKDFPNVTVEIQGVGYDQLYTKESTVLASGSDSIDILAMDPVWTADFAKNGWSTPLDEFLTADERAQFKPGFLDPFTSDGKIVGLPFGINFKTMFYNTDTAKALGLSGPPGTYEELAEIGAGLKGKNPPKFVQGFGWAQAEGLICDWTQILFAFGGKYFDNGKWAFNNDAGVAALTYMVDNLKANVFDPASITYNDRTVMNPFFVADYLAMLSWGLWGWNMSTDPKESKVTKSVGVGLTYGSKAAGVKSATCFGGGADVINPTSKNRDIAVEWIKRAAGINNRANQEYLLKATGTLPTLAAIWDDPKIADINPAAASLTEQAKYIVSRPGNHVLGYQSWSQMLQVEITSALTQQKSPKDALDEAVQQSVANYAPFGL